MCPRGQSCRSSYTPQRQPAIAFALYNVYAVKTSKEKTPSVARRCFPNALKGRKGEKEMGILNCKNLVGAQSPEERECRRESESLNPLPLGLPPLTIRNVIQFLLFVKKIVKNFFRQYFLVLFFIGFSA